MLGNLGALRGSDIQKGTLAVARFIDKRSTNRKTVPKTTFFK